MKIHRPVLRYHGGKWILAPWIISYFPEHRVYVEPYGGAASVLLRKPPSEIEVYNDLNGELVNLFEILRDKREAEELARAVSLTPWSYQEWVNSYTRSSDRLENARRLIVCSYMSVGTDATCRRSGKSGFRNYSKISKVGAAPVQSWRNLPNSLLAVVDRLQGRMILENRDAFHVMKQHDSLDTLHYVDPPYLKATRSDSGDDYQHEMSDEEHLQLAKVLQSLKGSVVLSGYPSRIYDDLYQGWQRIEKASLADGAKKRTEVLWIKKNKKGPNESTTLGTAGNESS